MDKIHSLILLSLCALIFSCQNGRTNSSSEIAFVAIEDEPNSFDPRLIRTCCAINIAHLLGEGLFRFEELEPVPALVDTFIRDESGTHYTFVLKKANWSNKDPITARDFEKTIKSVMDPSTPSPHAHQLYAIKGAQKAKEGRISVEDIGIKALDDKTLVIELEKPSPNFLKLLATHFFYPVHPDNLPLNKTATLISSGPFLLESYTPSSEIVLKKNDQFWDADSVSLKQLKLLPINDQLALQMFESGEIDWVGSPIGRLPPDAIPMLIDSDRFHTQDALGTFWLRTNTLDAKLSSRTLRKALFDTIERNEIITHITQGGQKPATTIVPPLLLGEQSRKSDHHSSLLFPETITLTYIHNERNHKIAQYLEQKWKKALGLKLILEANEPKAFYERMGKGQFQLSLGSWFADIPDALNFLEVFKYKEAKTNGTGFGNQEYTDLLDQASFEMDESKRKALLARSEKILMDDYPVIPLYFAVFTWVSNPRLTGVTVSPLGFFDFRKAKKE